MNALQDLAAQLREEETPISPHAIDPAEPPEMGERAAAGRTPENARECALAIESIREGYLLHYGTSRLLSGHDPDLGLLAGDYLYALGLDRLARLGDTHAVAVLADLISRCAQLHTEAREPEIPALWESAVNTIAGAQPRAP